MKLDWTSFVASAIATAAVVPLATVIVSNTAAARDDEPQSATPTFAITTSSSRTGTRGTAHAVATHRMSTDDEPASRTDAAGRTVWGP